MMTVSIGWERTTLAPEWGCDFRACGGCSHCSCASASCVMICRLPPSLSLRLSHGDLAACASSGHLKEEETSNFRGKRVR